MAVEIIGDVSCNTVDISPDLMASLNGVIRLAGRDNVVSIGAMAVSQGFYFDIRDGSRVKIGRSCYMGQLSVFADHGSRLLIGSQVGFTGSVRFHMHETAAISVGRGCLFASEIEVTVSDMHSVVDHTTGRRINPAGDIVIGDRVWVGLRALILKNVTIGEGSVVGAAAVVTRSAPAYSLLAGNPARVVRANTSWVHELLPVDNEG